MAQMMNTLNAVSFNQARLVNLSKVVLMYAPEFAPDQAAALQGNAQAIARSLNGQQWVTLQGWLDSLTTAAVQCRRSGFTMRVNRRNGMAATLLPHNISASIAYRNSAGVQQQHALEAVIDSEAGFLKLQLPFPGKELGDAVSTAMMNPAAGATVNIDYSHDLKVRIPAPPPPPPPPPKQQSPPIMKFPRAPLGNILSQAGGMRAMATPMVAQGAGVPVALRMEPQMLSAATGAQFMTAKRSEAATLKANLPTGVAGAKLNTVDTKRVFVDTPPPPQGDRIEQRPLNGRLSLPITYPQSDINVFPDLPRVQQNGWGQVPGNPKLHFRDSEKIDTFFYVPTRFKLGYYFESGDGGGVQPPLRVEVLRDASGDKIRATLVALPTIEDTERKALRTFLHDQVLQRLQPFVYLEPRSGIHAEFSPDFTSGTAADPKNLPAQVQFRALEIASPHERIKLQFEMPASQYSIFMEMMKFGIFGRVTLRDQGLNIDVSVRLQLSDMITNLVQIENVEAAADAPKEEAGASKLTLRNLLGYPVQISSLSADLLDVGDTSGVVVDAESVDLLPAGGKLEPSADPASATTFTLRPQRLVGWDSTVIQPGQLKVVAGAAEHWLDQINRDPSLAPHEYQIGLQILASAAIAPRVQLVRARLYKDGDPNPRTRFDCRPDAAPPSLRVSMTLSELMGGGGAAPTFSLEYETLLADGSLGPTQRVCVAPDAATLTLRALAPTEASIYTIEYDGPAGPVREELTDAAALNAKVAQLRTEGRRWEIFTRERAMNA